MVPVCLALHRLEAGGVALQRDGDVVHQARGGSPPEIAQHPRGPGWLEDGDGGGGCSALRQNSTALLETAVVLILTFPSPGQWRQSAEQGAPGRGQGVPAGGGGGPAPGHGVRGAGGQHGADGRLEPQRQRDQGSTRLGFAQPLCSQGKEPLWLSQRGHGRCPARSSGMETLGVLLSRCRGRACNRGAAAELRLNRVSAGGGLCAAGSTCEALGQLC